jgi:hypothetical protein
MTKNKLYKTTFLILFLAFLISSGISQKDTKFSPRIQGAFETRGPGEKFTAWIYFKDKGPGMLQKMEEARLTLNIKSMNRRLRHGLEELVDEYDLPVYQPYVDAIEPFIDKFRHTSRWLNAVSVETTGSSLELISGFQFVSEIDEVLTYTYRDPIPDPQTEPSLDPFPETSPLEPLLFDYGMSLTQVKQLKVPALHDMGYTGRGVLICMLDSGFNNLGHEALDHLDIVATWDFLNGDSNVFYEEGQLGSGDHGTNTLGVIAGYEPGQLIGPAFGASFLLGKTENGDLSWERHIEEDHWVAGAEWADSHGADIISSSLGYRDVFTHGEEQYSWQDMDGNTTIVAKGANIAASRGILIVNSAGNEGLSLSHQNTLISPADSAYVLAAGAINPQGRRVFFSSYGPTADGRIKPDVMAMGDSVYSAGPNALDEYELVDGTSFACPLIAGVAALLLEINPSWTNHDIMTAMKSTASQSDSPDNSNGWGIVNAQEAAFYPLKSIHAPDLFSLRRLANDYGFFIQFVDQLSWAPNPRNADQVVFYRLYAKQLGTPGQTFVLLAEMDPQTFSFLRRGFLEDENFLYKITSVSATGQESDPNYALQ